MTPKIIELKQAPVVLVELPEECKFEKHLGKSVDGTFLFWDSAHNLDEDTRPHGQIVIDTEPRNRWRILGILSDLTEEQFVECVEHKTWGDETGLYRHYLYHTIQARHIMNEFAKQSFDTLLQSENVYTRNPLQEWYDNSNLLDEVSEKDMTLRYQEAQSRTINPDRTLVLIKKED